jgi:hypothetical protein
VIVCLAFAGAAIATGGFSAIPSAVALLTWMGIPSIGGACLVLYIFDKNNQYAAEYERAIRINIITAITARIQDDQLPEYFYEILQIILENHHYYDATKQS